MRVKFEATDATGKVHKRSSMSHIYSHCIVMHFAQTVDAQGEALRYLRLCTCVACSKTLHHRQQMQKIASIVLDEGEVK